MRLARRKEIDVSESESSEFSTESESDFDVVVDVAFYKRKIKRHVRQLSLVIKHGSILNITKPKVTLLREKLIKDCEHLFRYADCRKEALNILWLHAWYEPIKMATVGPISKEHKTWLKAFISCAVGQFSLLVELYDDLVYMLYIFIGDLYRYSYMSCDENEFDWKLSRKYYEKAARHSPTEMNGRPFNQIALLLQCTNKAWEGLLYFLRALVMDKPFERAVDNIKRLNESDFGENEHQKVVFNFMMSTISSFNRATFEKWSKEFDYNITRLLTESRVRDVLEMIYYISTYSIAMVKYEGVEDYERHFGALLCRSLCTLLAHFDEHNLLELESCNSNDKQLVLQALTMIGEFLDAFSDKFTTKKIPVALKIQYQNVVQLYAKFLNAVPQFGGYFLTLLETANDEQGDAPWTVVLNWYLSGPVSDDYEPIIGNYTRKCVANASTPISYDGNEFVVKNNSDKELTFMKNISKIHSEYNKTQKKDDAAAFPVYLFPDHTVLLAKISVLQNLLKMNRFTAIVAHSVLSKLDKIKRESQPAREAIRWLEMAVQSGRVRMPTIGACSSLMTVEEAAVQFLHDKELLERKSLFATILVAGNTVAVENGDISDAESSTKYASRFLKYVLNFWQNEV